MAFCALCLNSDHLVSEVPRCVAIVGTLLAEHRATDPKTHLPPGTQYMPGWSINVGMRWYLRK